MTAETDDVAFPTSPAPAANPHVNGSESFETAKPVAVIKESLTTRPYLPSNGAVGRTLPHSIEAEEHLLSCCLLDGNDVIARCVEAKIKPSSFYDAKHGIIFECLLDLFARKETIDVAVVAEELKTAKRLDQVGGYAFLVQVSSRIPTTAQASYFVDKVREQALLREIIHAATVTVEDCYGFSGGIDEFAQEVKRRLDTATTVSKVSTAQHMPWDDLLAFDPKHDPDCLMGNRFLGRTGAAVIVAPSGVGKSVLALQLGACASLKRPFFGMAMHLPMRVLYLQAEDDFGDVAESAQGFIRGTAVSNEDRAELNKRLRIERWNDASGHQFLSRLKQQHAKWPFDLVIINPLFSFCGCNVSEQRELSPFLRNGLNGILNETRSAAIVVHHTNKPPADPSIQDKAMNAELRYIGSGSAELTNWARAYITLQGVRSAGDHVHKMVFVKRGGRTGIVDDEGKPTHSVLIEHSKTGLCWLPSDYRPDSSAGGKFQNRFDLQRALTVYDSSKHWTENEILIARDQDIAPRSVRRHRQHIEEAG